MSVTFRAVHVILWQDWDPIGCGVPDDEYDDYVPAVVAMLTQGKGRDDVAAYLRATAADALACPVDEEGLTRTLDKLFALQS